MKDLFFCYVFKIHRLALHFVSLCQHCRSEHDQDKNKRNGGTKINKGSGHCVFNQIA